MSSPACCRRRPRSRAILLLALHVQLLEQVHLNVMFLLGHPVRRFTRLFTVARGTTGRGSLERSHSHTRNADAHATQSINPHVKPSRKTASGGGGGGSGISSIVGLLRGWRRSRRRRRYQPTQNRRIKRPRQVDV